MYTVQYTHTYISRYVLCDSFCQINCVSINSKHTTISSYSLQGRRTITTINRELLCSNKRFLYKKINILDIVLADGLQSEGCEWLYGRRKWSDIFLYDSFFQFRSNSKSHRKESRLSRAELEARYQEKGQLTFS